MSITSVKMSASQTLGNIQMVCKEKNISFQLTFDKENILFDVMDWDGRVMRLTKEEFLDLYIGGFEE